MSVLSVWFTAVGLAMDAFAVSLSSGMSIKKLRLSHAFKFGIYFGLFQLIMPIIGFLAGNAFSAYIKAFDHWIAFLLLSFIGGKMIYETFQDKEEALDLQAEAVMKPKNMILMAIATSIDAMAVGVSLAFLGADIIFPSLVIGLTAFVLSTLGALVGKKLGNVFEKSACRIGGVILVGIGLNILMEHLRIEWFF